MFRTKFLKLKKALINIQNEIDSTFLTDILQEKEKKEAQVDLDDALNVEELFWKENTRLN